MFKSLGLISSCPYTPRNKGEKKHDIKEEFLYKICFLTDSCAVPQAAQIG